MGYQAASLVVLWLAQALFGVVTMDSGRTRNHGHFVCSTWGNYHFKTFDGDYYEFPGNCTYNFASHCGGSYSEFSVHIHRSIDNDHPVIDKILITIKDVNIELKSSIAVVDGLLAQTPYYKDGIIITKSVAYMKVYTKTGFTLMWNKKDAVMVELDPIYNNYTCGLCGDYNGINDLSVEGKNPIQFGNLQNIHDPKETCTDLDETKAITDTSSCSEYRLVCENHLGDAAFADCKDFLNVEAYINACMLDMCSCGQSSYAICLCSTISEFSRQCSHAGGHPGNWRTDSLCPIQCPNNMIYQESSSPCMNTCSNLDSNQVCMEHYMDDCFCPEGTVQDDYTDRGCVPVSECNCKYKESLYLPGEHIQNDCNECRCISGKWNCTDNACPGPCSIEGGAHITTFDGKLYTFHGDCYYVLSKGIENSSHVIYGEITRGSYLETSLKSIILLMDNKKNVVTFKTDGTVLLNDQGVTLPQVTATFSISQPTDSYIILNTAFGLHMQIQLQPTMQLYITMDESFMGQLQGLCGNFNYKEIDDFEISVGLVEATASAFANTWKANPLCSDVSDRLDDPCSISIENKKYADHWCSLLEDYKSPFAKCHSTIDPTGYARRCRYDSCSCKDSEKCMCSALSSYVRACAEKGIILWGWRKDICKINSCPSSQIYLYNLTTCQPTCRSLAEGGKACASGFTAVDGCGCPDGEFLNEKDQCVPKSQCSCYNDGSYVNPLESINKLNERCTCRDGKLICSPFLVEACPKGKVYYDCNNETSGLKAPNQRSCKTLHIDNLPTACLSGCVCPNGLLDDGAGGCVLEKDCPCSYKQDIYPSETKINVDCNTCLCQSGRWNCTKHVCYRTCSIYGSGHYITFDEKLYDFDGKCEFVAAKDSCGLNNSNGTFSIVTENVPCGTTGVTCSRAITVFLGNKILKLADEKLVETPGESVISVSYLTHEVGIYLVIQADNGILLIWDKKTTIFIKVSPAYKGKLCGLCGNFDDNSQNDFMADNMLQVIDVLKFGNSWKINPTCPDATQLIDPCLKNPHRQAWAEKQCGLIKSDVFKICHSKVDPHPFYEACVSDACACDSGGDCECFCTAVAAYAQECTKTQACVYWRTPDICPIFCDYYNPKDECEWHYHPCGNTIETCRSINNVYTNVTTTYLEGCYPTCPKDKPIYDEDKKICVPPELCGCFINNNHYNIGDHIPNFMPCQSCNCTAGGKVNCVYDKSACFCIVNGKRYEEGSIIYRVHLSVKHFSGDDGSGAHGSGEPGYGEPGSGEEVSEFCNVTICVNSTLKSYLEICPTTTTTSVTSTTVTTTTLTTTTVTTTSPWTSTSIISTTCVYEKVCRWTEWFDVNKPSDGLDSGDYETYEEIRKQHQFCSVPEQIDCRAVNDPDVSLKALKQNVYCNVSNGLICKNSEQTGSLWQRCFNYEIRVSCCDYECYTDTTTPTTTTETTPVTTTTPITTTSPTTITIPTTPTTTTETTPVTTTTPITTTSPITTTKPTTPTTTTETTSVTTTTLITTTVPNCKKCEWSRWFDVSSPKFEPSGGDFETYVNIRNAGYDVCEKPEKIACRSTRSPNLSLESNGQYVTCNVSSGLICKNDDQTGGLPLCFNYEISVYCCQEEDYCTKTTPSTTSLSTSTSTTPTETSTLTSTPLTTTVTPTTTQTITETTPFCAPVCSWSQWFNVSYPSSDPDGGEFETYENIRKVGLKVCEQPQNISCRSKDDPNKALKELGENVTCEVSSGLVCYNDPLGFPCSNYEIKVFCCQSPDYCTTTPTTTPTTTTETSTLTSTPITTTVTPTTTQTITETTPTETSTLTSTPLTTTVTPTTTQTITETTPTETSTLTSTPLTTTVTPTTTQIITETTPFCAPNCSWSQWFNVSYPSSDPNGGEFETYENIRKAGLEVCEQPQNISCRSMDDPNKALKELGENVTCEVSSGLVCYNDPLGFPCSNYEIKVFCCQLPDYCTTTPTTTPTTTTETSTLTSTPLTTTVTPTTTQTITETTPTETSTLTSTPLTTTVTPTTTQTITETTPTETSTLTSTPLTTTVTPTTTQTITETTPTETSTLTSTPLTTTVTPTTTQTITETTPTETSTLTSTPLTTTVTPTTTQTITETTPTETSTLTSTPLTTTVTPTTTQTITETTPTETSTLTSTPLTTTVTPTTIQTITETTPFCAPNCSWSQWFNVSYPSSDPNGGEFETYENIRKAGLEVCEQPQNISCRSMDDPNKALKELGENVTCEVSSGLVCYNDPLGFPCSNYEIKVFCCQLPDYCTTTPTTTPTTTTETSTLTSTPLTTTVTPTTTQTITETTPTETSTLTSTPLTTTVTPTTIQTITETTPFCAPNCSWSQWFNVSYPSSDPNGGEFETYENIRKAGLEVCEQPQNISCRSMDDPNKALKELGENVTCEVSSGLVCYNDPLGFPCSNYEIKVFCCQLPDYCTTTPTTTPTTTTETSTLTSTPLTTTVTPTTTQTITETTPTETSTLTSTPLTTTVTPTTTQTITETTPTETSTLTSTPLTTTVTPTTTQTITETTPTETSTLTSTPLTTTVTPTTTQTIMTPTETSTLTSTPLTTTVTPTTTQTITETTPTETSTLTSTPLTTTVTPTTTQIITETTPTETSTLTSTPLTTTVTPTPTQTIMTPTETSTLTSTPLTTTVTPTTTQIITETTPTETSTLTSTPLTTTVTPTPTQTIMTPTETSTLTSTPLTTTVTPTTTQIITETTPTETSTLTSTPLTTTVTPTPTQTIMTPTETSTLTSTPLTTTVTPTTTQIITETTPTETSTLTSTPLTTTVTPTPTQTIMTPTETSTLTSTPLTTTVTPTTTQIITETTPTETSTLTSTPLTTTVTPTTTQTITETTEHPIYIVTPKSTPVANVTSEQQHGKTTSLITTTSEKTTTPESTTSMTPCVCVYERKTYPEGEIKSGEVGEKCYKVVCSENCTVTVQVWDCKSPSTTTPTTTSTVTSSTTTTTTHSTTTPIVTSPEIRSTTKQSTSTHTTVTPSIVPPPDCMLVPPRKYNETWKIDNCTVARCLGGTSVNITRINCKPLRPTICANGLQPIAVTDDDQCCQHWVCPCPCLGWGDPHFKTFDGTRYDFQGNCSYILVEEIIKKISTFGVYIDNYNCGAVDQVSCPRDIIVKYENQTIRLAKTFLLEPTVQVIVNDEVVGIPYAKNGIKLSTSGIFYVVEIPSIKSSIKYSGLRFQIDLPYELFGNNTQGQCGTCNNNTSDDCLTKSGNYVSKCEAMAATWLFNDTQKSNCVPPYPNPTPNPIPCPPSPICQLINDSIFKECHKIFPPEDYYKACVFDSCHAPNSSLECSSLAQYAQLCAERGFCIPWRANASKCKLTCPSNKVYNACGPVKQRTCQTSEEQYAAMQNDTHFIEGCFCPNDTVRHSEAVDICVSSCGCVGPDNVPRKFGETFQLGCLDCVCREGGSGLYCEKRKCSMTKSVNCELEGFIPVTRINSSDPCCNETVCICEPSQCTTKPPKCEIGYEAIAHGISDGQCCTLYTCVPKKVCVHENAEYLPGTTVFLDKCKNCVCSNSTRGSGAEIQCTDVPCNKQCSKGYELLNSTSDCCGECKQTHCLINDNVGLSLLQPGESRKSENDSCTVYNCTEIKGQFISSVSQTPCPYFNEDNCVPGTIELSPNGCCKQCIEISPSCKLHQTLEYLSHNNCQSEDVVNITYCEGPCNTLSKYSAAASKMSHKCTCCQEVKTSERSVTMNCSDGHQEELRYVMVEECNCVSTDCESSQSQKALTTARARRITRGRK